MKLKPLNEEEIFIQLCLECGNKERGDLLNSKEKEVELRRYAKVISEHFGQKECLNIRIQEVARVRSWFSIENDKKYKYIIDVLGEHIENIKKGIR